MSLTISGSPGAARSLPRITGLPLGSRNSLQLFIEWLSTTDVAITAVGQIDMSTAHPFTDQVLRYAGNCKNLRLDLRKVTFFDCAGFAALCHIDDRCHIADVTWAVQPAACVSRVVALCDPLRRLPISDTQRTGKP
ncbi:MAG: STAS domain-containing protein [Mycobacterium sp.]